jgi:hypothetical protein
VPQWLLIGSAAFLGSIAAAYADPNGWALARGTNLQVCDKRVSGGGTSEFSRLMLQWSNSKARDWTTAVLKKR